MSGKVSTRSTCSLVTEAKSVLVVQGGLRTLDVYSLKILIEIHGPQNAKKMWSLVQPLNYSWRHLTPKKEEKVSSEKKLLSLFSKDLWTHHFILICQRGKRKLDIEM